MRSQILFGLGIVMLLALIFGATLISQYAGNDEVVTNATNPSDGPVILGSPLLFSTTEAAYRPDDESISKRYFQAFHEVGNQEVHVPFWFKNPYPVPVAVTVRGRSCTSCTQAYLGTIPPAEMQKYVMMNALAGLPASPLSGFSPIGLMQQALLVNVSMERQPLDFEKPDNGIIVPAAVNDKTPTWGVFEMVVKISGVGPKNVSALMAMQVGKKAPVPQDFRVALVGVPPFDIEPKKIELGEMVEGTPPRNFDLFCFSSTRELSDFPVPSLSVNLKDAFVVVGTPVPLTAPERLRIVNERLAANSVVRVVSGYRIPIIVHRRNPNPPTADSPSQPDIGPFERQIGVGGIGTTAHSLTLSGTVVGIVGLAEGNVIDLKDFSSRSGTEKIVQLVSDRMDLDLQLGKDESLPKYFQSAELGAPRTESGRRYWSLKVIVPKDAESSDLPPGSSILLRGRVGEETIRIRIPVKGRAFARGQ